MTYNEHELRELPQLFQNLGVKPEDLAWFDMDGNIVSGAEVIDKIGRLNAHLGKEDAKYYCTMVSPSDEEAKAMGETVPEQVVNGRAFIFDVMDVYAQNFHRKGITDRHNIVAFAIPHIYKSEAKQQIHWHIIMARKDASNKCKLSPLTNHRNTSKGIVKGGFDRVAFDAECEKHFDLRFNYKRPVEQSFEYLLAEKKGTSEEKAVQEDRLAQQNLPELKDSIEAAITRRIERLAKEAAERAGKERAIEEAESQKVAEKKSIPPQKQVETPRPSIKHVSEVTPVAVINANKSSDCRLAQEATCDAVRQEQNDIVAGYRSVRPIIERICELKNKAYELYDETNKSGINISKATVDALKGLAGIWKQNNEFSKQIREAKNRSDAVRAVCSIISKFNPTVGLTVLFLAMIAEDIRRSNLLAQKKEVLVNVESFRDKLTALEAEKNALIIQNQKRLQQYLDAECMYQEYRDGLQRIDKAVHDAKIDIQKETPESKPNNEIVKMFTVDYKRFRIKKASNGIYKLQQSVPDRSSPIVEHKYSKNIWEAKAIFTAFSEVAKDANGVYFKIKDYKTGKIRYINQYGNDLLEKQKQRLGIGIGKDHGGPHR